MNETHIPHLDTAATVPLTGASRALLRAVRAEGVNPRRVHDQRLRGSVLQLFYTRPYDRTTYLAEIDLKQLEEKASTSTAKPPGRQRAGGHRAGGGGRREDRRLERGP